MKKLLSLALASTISAMAVADQSSTFEASTENWRTHNDAKNLMWISSDGNPGGYLQATDISTGEIWYFVTPTSWAGDWSKYITLSFDLKQMGSGSGVDADDLQIVGQNGITLTWRGKRSPASTWTNYNIALSPATFAVDSNTYKSVLKNVVELRIRGEFISGPDQAGLDNVKLTTEAQAVSGIVYDFGKYSITCANTTTGQKITVDSQTTIDWNCEKNGLSVSKGDAVKITISGKPIK